MREILGKVLKYEKRYSRKVRKVQFYFFLGSIFLIEKIYIIINYNL